MFGFLNMSISVLLAFTEILFASNQLQRFFRSWFRRLFNIFVEGAATKYALMRWDGMRANGAALFVRVFYRHARKLGREGIRKTLEGIK